jgi:alpha-1,3-mannosyltransferase
VARWRDGLHKDIRWNWTLGKLTSLFVGSVDQHFYYVSNLTPSIWYQVYPAGFLYMYGFLKWLTDGGNNVLACQYIFCGLYVFNAAIVLTIYTLLGRSMQSFIPKNSLQYYHTVWSWRVAMVITCLSKRIHSIFVLRLFNDGPCMILFYVSVLLFAKSYWRIGCALFSLAVSIKMNVLLFAPGLLLLLLQSSPGIMETIICLGICAALQIILGAPFLCTYPVSYIRKAFEFDRVSSTSGL